MSKEKGWNLILDIQFVKQAIQNSRQDETCDKLHSWSCNQKALLQFYSGVRSSLKLYIIIHLLPLLIFKRKNLKQQPIKEIKKLLKAYICSLIFAGGSSAIPRRAVCFVTKFINYSGQANWLSCAFGGLSLLIQSPNRQAEIALYGFAKGWQTAYLMMKRRKYPVQLSFGNCLINAFSIALITFTYLNKPAQLRNSIRYLLNILLNEI